MPIAVSEDPPQRVVVEFKGPALHRGEAETLDLMMTPQQAESFCQLMKQYNSLCLTDQSSSPFLPMPWKRYAISSFDGQESSVDPFWDEVEGQLF